MHDVIARLRTKPSLQVIDRAQSWEICVTKPDGLVFEVTVPHDVLEWFVTVRQSATSQEVWSDWTDYYAVGSETEAELRSNMVRDLELFVERVLDATVRIIETRTFLGRRQRLEWRTAAGWKKVSMCEDVA